ncbi:hypothetical protein AB0E83_12460 [Streptomyces sp. NPDC035033]|uniref:hypothetical protein n=1 Tax=Streptomyces sp. NPDC035033 TaxID=3155368 RepID=UPI0033E18D28
MTQRLLRIRHADGEHGSARVEFADLAVVAPAPGFTIIQTGFHSHTKSDAHSAARQGIQTGRQHNAGAGDDAGDDAAQAQAQTYLARRRRIWRGAVAASGGGERAGWREHGKNGAHHGPRPHRDTGSQSEPGRRRTHEHSRGAGDRPISRSLDRPAPGAASLCA